MKGKDELIKLYDSAFEAKRERDLNFAADCEFMQSDKWDDGELESNGAKYAGLKATPEQINDAYFMNHPITKEKFKAMYPPRFTTDGRTLNGYYSIEDSMDESNNIWIDCKKELLHIIINALNKELNK